jgi:hypothetical protein
MTTKSVKMWGVFDKFGDIWSAQITHSNAIAHKEQKDDKVRPVTVTWDEPSSVGFGATDAKGKMHHYKLKVKR